MYPGLLLAIIDATDRLVIVIYKKPSISRLTIIRLSAASVRAKDTYSITQKHAYEHLDKHSGGSKGGGKSDHAPTPIWLYTLAIPSNEETNIRYWETLNWPHIPMSASMCPPSRMSGSASGHAYMHIRVYFYIQTYNYICLCIVSIARLSFMYM